MKAKVWLAVLLLPLLFFPNVNSGAVVTSNIVFTHPETQAVYRITLTGPREANVQIVKSLLEMTPDERAYVMFADSIFTYPASVSHSLPYGAAANLLSKQILMTYEASAQIPSLETGAILLHEATHLRDYQNCAVVGSVQSEVRAYIVSVRFLLAHNYDYKKIAQVVSAAYFHGDKYPYRWLNPDCETAFDPETGRWHKVVWEVARPLRAGWWGWTLKEPTTGSGLGQLVTIE